MKADDIMAKAELQFKKAKVKYADSIRKANEERGKEEVNGKIKPAFCWKILAVYRRRIKKIFYRWTCCKISSRGYENVFSGYVKGGNYKSYFLCYETQRY